MSQERAIFAGGCFWCMVQPFEELPGILSVLSGYTGGTTQNPTYEDVLTHQTGHTEAVDQFILKLSRKHTLNVFKTFDVESNTFHRMLF